MGRSAADLIFIERSWQVGARNCRGDCTNDCCLKENSWTCTGESYVMTMPIAERVERLADRVQAWVKLRHGAAAANAASPSLSTIIRRAREAFGGIVFFATIGCCKFSTAFVPTVSRRTAHDERR